jgi:hypothetical protein
MIENNIFKLQRIPYLFPKMCKKSYLHSKYK